MFSQSLIVLFVFVPICRDFQITYTVFVIHGITLKTYKYFLVHVSLVFTLQWSTYKNCLHNYFTKRKLGDICIQIFHLGRYIVGYTVGNLVLRRCFPVRLYIDALWSPAWKGLTSWLSFVMSNCEFVTFPYCIDS